MKIVEVDKNGFGHIPEGPLTEGTYIFCSIEELRDLWNAGYRGGYSDASKETTIPAVYFETYLTSKGITLPTISRKIMTPSEYIEWLDKEIGFAILSGDGWLAKALVDAKEKFLTIQFPPSPSSVAEKRKQAQANGYDDYCEAHDLPYRNECPLCPPLTDELPENNFTDGL